MASKLRVDNTNQVSLSQMEEKVLEFWDEVHAFEKSVELRPEDKPYVFYDGPPFATGLPHYGHLLASTIKDVVPRYWTMKGYRVDRVWGWDCHGIPIENMIEGELGLKGGKKGIEELGIDKFNAACRSAILRFDAEWEKVIRRLGRWVDFKNSYKTMDTTYMESVWWAFKTLYEKGLVYEGRRVILYCPRCSTPLSNFEIAMDNSYKEVTSAGTTYKFKFKNETNTYLLAWSTTPWNKLATPALAVNPNLTYVKVKQGNEHYILAESTLKQLTAEPYTVEAKVTGQELTKFEFELLYDFYPDRQGKRAGVVVADDFVTAEEGTGIVTLAVYGEDDYRVMLRENVQLVEHVDDEGKLKPEVTPFAGMFILKADPLINEDLKKRGLIYRDEPHTHSVAQCYRCSTRLYYAPIPAWFIDVQKLKSQMVKANESINWYPGHLKHGRFGKGLETAPDWNISRSRYWGTPMPVWVGENGAKRIIGSIAELKDWAVEPKKVENLTDIHREYIDDVEVWLDDARTVKGKRIPEVFDCWVESGSMPYASEHYPFENKERFEKRHPAQFIAEYIAQTRAWFYTLHVVSVGLFGKGTFENAVTTGTILAEDGAKMSKSKKNYPDPMVVVNKYGVDSLRLYLMSSPVMKADNLNFSEKSVDEIKKKVFNIFWNVSSFYKLYANDSIPSGYPKNPSHVLDRWLISKTEGLTKTVTAAMDAYDVVTASRALMEFVNELSTWYLRLSRDRFKSEDNSEPLRVLKTTLERWSFLSAPFAPFFSETIYHNLNDTDESIHWQDWPTTVENLIDLKLEQEMKLVQEVVEKSHARRKEVAIPVRQPLALLEVKSPKSASPDLLALIELELNVKKVDWQGDSKTLDIVLDTTITPELKAEGQARELIRKIQQARKDAGTRINETVEVVLPEWPEAFEDEIKRKVLATKLTKGNELTIIRSA